MATAKDGLAAVPESLHQRIKREREEDTTTEPGAVQNYRDYAEGIHRSTMNHDQRRILQQLIGHAFADNVCDLVLATMASRLDLTSFSSLDTTMNEWLRWWYAAASVSDIAYDNHYRTARDGNHALGLRWEASHWAGHVHEVDSAASSSTPEDDVADPESAGQNDRVPVGARGEGVVTLHHEDWWNGEVGMFVKCDSSGRAIYAVKDFDVMLQFRAIGGPVQRRRRTVYWPDRIERYIFDRNGWVPWMLPGDTVWPVPWVKQDGAPLGIPIVHFSNPRFGKGPYGASELAGGVLGLQDEINDIQRDITAAARLLGFPMLKAINVPQQNALVVGPGRVLGVPAGGELDIMIPGDLSQLISAHVTKIQTLSRNTGTPLHLISAASWPSGIALIRAEMPLVSKVTRWGKTVGPAWSTVAHQAGEMTTAFGGTQLSDRAVITAHFAAPEKLDDEALAAIDQLHVNVYEKLAGLPRVLMIKTGLVTEAEADAIIAERDARAQAMAAVLASRGGGPGEPDAKEAAA